MPVSWQALPCIVAFSPLPDPGMIETFYSKYTRALTFQNFSPDSVPHVLAPALGGGAPESADGGSQRAAGGGWVRARREVCAEGAGERIVRPLGFSQYDTLVWAVRSRGDGLRALMFSPWDLPFLSCGGKAHILKSTLYSGLV